MDSGRERHPPRPLLDRAFTRRPYRRGGGNAQRPHLPRHRRFTSYGELFLVPLDTPARAKRITRGTRLYHPVVGDGALTLFAIERRAQYSALVRIDPTNGTQEEIYAPPRSVLSMPALSPDEQHLAVVKNLRGVQTIELLQRDSTGDYTPTNTIAIKDAALFRPRFVLQEGASWIWFIADTDGILSLYQTPLSGGPVLQEILRDQVAVVDALPIDDHRIVYESYRSHGYTLREQTTGPLSTRSPSPRKEQPPFLWPMRKNVPPLSSPPANTRGRDWKTVHRPATPAPVVPHHGDPRRRGP